MQNAAKLRKLLRHLSREPRVKQAIAKAKRQSRGKVRTPIENLADMYLLGLAIAARFSRKKKARALNEQMDIAHFLLQVSLVLKENIFERPEVKEFFSRTGESAYLTAQKWLGAVSPGRKPPRSIPTRRSPAVSRRGAKRARAAPRRRSRSRPPEPGVSRE